MEVCPNVNLPEWKVLVRQVGEVEAYRAFRAHDFSIPDVVTVPEFRKIIKLTSPRISNEQKIRVQKRIKAYNRVAGTSHFVNFTPFGPTSWKVGGFRMNYLPVNLRMQQLREKNGMNIDEHEYSFLETYDDTNKYPIDGNYPNTYDPLKVIKEDDRNNETEATLGYFNEEGDFKPHEFKPDFGKPQDRLFAFMEDDFGDEFIYDDDFIVNPLDKPRYNELINLKRIEQNELRNTEAKIRAEIKSTKPVGMERLRMLHEANERAARIEQIDQEITEIKNSNNLADAEKFFLSDKKRLQKLLTQGSDMSHDDLRWATRTVNLWLRAGDFGPNVDNLFWTIPELNVSDEFSGDFSPLMKALREKFIGFASDMSVFDRQLALIRNKLVNEAGKKAFREEFTWDNTRQYKDISKTKSYLLDISHIDHELAHLMHKLGKDADSGVLLQIEEVMGEINRLFEKSGLKSTKLGYKDYSIFQQTFSNDDNRITGNMVVRNTQLYYDTVVSWANARRAAIEKIKETADPDTMRTAIQEINNRYFDKMKSVSILIDVRRLPNTGDSARSEEVFTEQEQNDYVDLLKRTLGSDYDRVMEEVMDQLSRFEEDARAMYDIYKDMFAGKQGEFDLAYDRWMANNSPYREADMFYGTKNKNKIYGTPTHYYTTTIAKRFDDRGKDLGFYDKKYEALRQDENLSELYDYIMDLMAELRAYLPFEKTNILQVNSIPFINKSIIENYVSDGMASAFSSIMDAMKASISAEEDKASAYSHIDVLTGAVDFKLQTQFIKDIRPEVNDYITRKQIEYTLDNHTEPREQHIKEWEREAINNIALRKSYDLPTVLKMFALMAISYEHKSKVDLTMQTAAYLIKNSLEESPVTNATQDDKALARKDKLTNIQESVEHYMKVFYGYRVNNQHAGQKKRESLASAEERKVMNEINAILEDAEEAWHNKEIGAEEYQRIISELDAQYEKQLHQFSGRKMFDHIFKYYQLLNLGWNPFSAMSNYGFGFISNFTQAADGRKFTQGDMKRAYTLLMHNMGPSGRFSATGRKITALAHKFDITKSMRYEITQRDSKDKLQLQGTLNNTKEYLSGFKMMSATEWLNQAPIMLCLMFNKEITDKNGVIYSVWDAFDENGELHEDFRTDENIKQWSDYRDGQAFKNLRAEIDEWIQFTHGNYDNLGSPIIASSVVFYKMAIMFRRWALMGFYDRFGGEQYYHTSDMVRKGRYRSYNAASLAVAGATIGTLTVPFIGTGIGFAIGALAGGSLSAFTKSANKEMNFFQETLFVTRQLLLKIPFAKKALDAAGISYSDFSEERGYSDVDAANMRRNLNELMQLVALQILGMILLGAVKAMWPEEKKRFTGATLYFLINQMTRLNTDILFYSNPTEIRRLNKNIFPLITLWDDMNEFGKAVTKAMHGDLYYKSGPFKGENRMLIRGLRLVPFGKSVIRTRTATGTSYRKDQWTIGDYLDYFDLQAEPAK